MFPGVTTLDRHVFVGALAALVHMLLGTVAHAATVKSIRVMGSSTNSDVILSLLDTRVGTAFNSRVWEDDLQRLRNTERFYEVRGEVQEDGEARHLTIHAFNRFSLIPIIKYKQGGGTSLLTAGVYEVNLFGRLLEAGAQYENMNAHHGAVAWFRHPYLLSRRNQFGAEVYVHSVDLPLLTLAGEKQAHFDNEERRINVRLLHEWHAGVRVGFEASVYTTEFLIDNSTPERTQRNANFLADHPLRSGRTASLTPRVVLGELNYNEFQVSGLELTLQAEIAHRAIGSEFDFIRGECRWLGAWLPTRNWNVAAQAQLGTKSGHEVQHKFYLGGLDTARGFLDGQFRGDHFWLVNLEARPTLWRSPRVVLQGNLFADVGKAWDEQRFSAAGLEDPFVSGGAGLRVILPRVYRAVLRLDAARTLSPIQQTGVAVGLQQFF